MRVRNPFPARGLRRHFMNPLMFPEENASLRRVDRILQLMSVVLLQVNQTLSQESSAGVPRASWLTLHFCPLTSWSVGHARPAMQHIADTRSVPEQKSIRKLSFSLKKKVKDHVEASVE